MKQLIWEVPFWCETCNKDIMGRVYHEESDKPLSEEEKARGLELLKHYHQMVITLRVGNAAKILNRTKLLQWLGLIVCGRTFATIVHIIQTGRTESPPVNTSRHGNGSFQPD
jgi:hypothetical protein